MKNVADTGKKVLRYTGAGGDGECRYNYSDVKPVATLTDMFQTIEATLEAGRRMDFKRRFDRLGLDEEMILLGRLLAEHQASEVGAIAPTLRSIAQDTELIQRVRQRAAKLLEQSGDAGS